MRRLGELLVERGLVSENDRAEAEALHRDTGASVGDTLVRLGAISESSLLDVLAEKIGLPLLDPSQAPEAEKVRETMLDLNTPASWFVENEVIAWRESEEGMLQVAGPHLYKPAIQEAIEQWRKPTQQYIAPSLLLEPIMLGLRGPGFGAASDPTRLLELAEEAPVIDFVNSVLAEAVAAGASDIHFEPFEDRVLVRLRVDGVLTQRRQVARDMFDAITSRIKLLSGMDIAERRLPQDGRQSLRVFGRDLDVRISTLPTRWGESTVVRLLGNTKRIPPLAELGLTQDQSAILRAAIEQPNGLVLITGPTGSGKTTTVYRLISELNDGVRKILTIEDPIEFDLPGVLQMNTRPDIGLDFATGLRSILRQDPDIIFVGEIRDSETARTAVQAALTGHLVISTVHTNSALAAIARLVDLGVERFLLADVLRTVIGQRLLRRLCPSCATAEPDAVAEQHAAALLPPPMHAGAPNWRHAHACQVCARTGFKGRVAVFEVARVDAAMQAAIRTDASEAELAAIARSAGFTNMLQNGVAKARTGETAYLEALRVLGASDS